LKIKKTAISGTLESSDIQITVSKNDDEENAIDLQSPVKHLFEEEILRVITEELNKHQLTGVYVRAIDKGALDCTIAARMQTAIYRACESELNWEVL
jgi:citrate lyase subunit gamma (acyl carrier protein)